MRQDTCCKDSEDISQTVRHCSVWETRAERQLSYTGRESAGKVDLC